jgi:asparagine synthase (glutamine-hydrolysing)
MCGIAGVFESAPLAPQPALLRRMIATLRHRGPDHEAVHAEEHLGLAHARLSIVDLRDCANQPMADVDGQLVIVLNGEIYNYKELRAELRTRGHRFLTDSDTEVVLEAYKEWGDEFLHRMNGMWALALWDRATRRLLLSRDRFGVKPLFLHEDRGRVLFASEIKALLAAGAPAEVNARTLSSIVYYAGGDRDSLSLFRDIESVAAGECVSLTPEGMRRWRWWKTTDHLVEVPRRFTDRVDRYRELLTDAVRIRLRTDVPTALSLSSGLDSSSIYGVWHELLARGAATSATDEQAVSPRPFIAAFPGADIDESDEAMQLVHRYGDDAQLVHVTPDRFRQDVDEVTWHQESLVWSAAVIAYHELYRAMAQQGIRVVLEGHGSDEVLGGYPQFSRVVVSDALRHARPLRAWGGAVAYSRSRGPMHDEQSISPLRVLGRAIAQKMKGKAAPAPHLFDRDFLGGHEILETSDDVRELSPLKRTLHMAFHARVLPAILRVFDRASMAHGVESRAPFLDWRLVTYAFSLPDGDAIGRGWTKRIQREVMRGILPDATLWRKRKIGFALPLPQWFATPSVTAILKSGLTDGTIDGAPGVRRDAYARLLHECESHGFTWQASGALWQAWSYAVWYQRFFRYGDSVTARLDTPTGHGYSTA